MRKILIIETFSSKKEQNLYYVMLPDVTEKGFYRAIGSFNAFFNSTRNPKANVTELRQFRAETDLEEGISFHKFWHNIDWDKLKTFASIWDFYKFIGYDYKTRSYQSGEKRKIWNGKFFVVPK